MRLQLANKNLAVSTAGSMANSCCKSQKQNPAATKDSTPKSKLSFNSFAAEINRSDRGLTITPPSTKINQGEFKSWLKYTPPNILEEKDKKHRHIICCPKIPIIHPFGPFRLIWDGIVILILIYTSIEVPYTLTFGVILAISDIAGFVALTVDIVLLSDILINFRTAYVDKYDSLHIITSPKLIAMRYIKSWFFLDLISSLPFEFIVPLFINPDLLYNQNRSLPEFVKILRIFRLLRGLKMLRVLRIFKLFKGFGRYFFVRETAMLLKCVRCLAAMLITAHYFACFWYLVGWYTQKNGKESWLIKMELDGHENPSNFTKYSYSWYWAIVTLFTTGYGDIVAHNEEEQWTASVCILIGTCFFAYFIGVLTTLLEEGDRVRMYELERVEEAQLFCAHHRIPKQLARAIISHIRYFCNYNYVFDHERIMASIPTYLQNHINSHLSQSLVELDIFKHLPSSVVGQIALKMTSTSCNSGHTLFKKGELSHEFFIQRTGRSVIYTKLKNGKTRVLERGDVCGEYAILSGKHRDTVKCLTWSEFYVFDINDLLSVLRENFLDPKEFYKAYKYIKTVLRKTLQKATKRKIKFKSRILSDDEKGYIHELSPDPTRSLINPLHSRTNTPINLANLADSIYKTPMANDSMHNMHNMHNRNETEEVLTSDIEIPSSLDIHKTNKPKLTPKMPQFGTDKSNQSNMTNTTRTPKKKALKKVKSISSRKLINKFSEFLQRENSAGRHELVLTKPNALSMDMERLDTSHREFEYSDHEDSQFFSDPNNHEMTNMMMMTMKYQQTHHRHHRGNFIKNRKKKVGSMKSRGRGGKFGGNRRRMVRQKTRRTANVVGMKIGAKIANMLHELTDHDIDIDDVDVDDDNIHNNNNNNKQKRKIIIKKHNHNNNKQNIMHRTDSTEYHSINDSDYDAVDADDDDDEYDIDDEKLDDTFRRIDGHIDGHSDDGRKETESLTVAPTQQTNQTTLIELSRNSNQYLWEGSKAQSRSISRNHSRNPTPLGKLDEIAAAQVVDGDDAGSDSFIYSTRDHRMLPQINTNI